MHVEGYSINLILEIESLSIRVKQNLNCSEQHESISQKLNAVADPLKILHGRQFENRCLSQYSPYLNPWTTYDTGQSSHIELNIF